MGLLPADRRVRRAAAPTVTTSESVVIVSATPVFAESFITCLPSRSAGVLVPSTVWAYARPVVGRCNRCSVQPLRHCGGWCPLAHRPCHAEGQGFESLHPLHWKDPAKAGSFSIERQDLAAIRQAARIWRRSRLPALELPPIPRGSPHDRRLSGVPVTPARPVGTPTAGKECLSSRARRSTAFREPERLHERRSSGQRVWPGCPVAVVHRRHARLVDAPGMGGNAGRLADRRQAFLRGVVTATPGPVAAREICKPA